MSRAERLLQLMQALRRRRTPVAALALAAEIGVSQRTLYRDIASLRAQGAHIEGEAGVGYLLRAGFTLPPLMFTPEEIEALVLGSRWVAQRSTDAALAEAGRNALAKIAAVVPAELRLELESTALLVGPGGADSAGLQHLRTIRATIRQEQKVEITYCDAQGHESQRTIWPFALSYFEQVRVVLAWCELRSDLRHFRVDRIGRFEPQPVRYPLRRQTLLRQWRAREGVPDS